MPKLMGPRPDRARLNTQARAVGVDREAKVIRGYVVAQAGPFKSDGRGEFDEASLKRIIELWPAAGLKSRFAHPTESSDGLGKYLGRARDPYLSTVKLPDGREVSAVRADLHLDPSAFSTPNGDLGQYILDLAESDPNALSSSLVLSKDEEYRLNKDGSRLRDEATGDALPPLWRPRRLYASDVVDEGDAVDGFLGDNNLSALLGAGPRYTRDYLGVATAILDRLFSGQPRGVVRSRAQAALNRYLDRRYGPMANRSDMLGPTLGGVLDGYIEAAASDERPREVILAQMAEASGLPVEEVSAIVQGEDADVPLPALQAFAKVLGCPLGELVTAAEADGIDYSGGGEEGGEGGSEEPAPEPVPAPAPEPSPMSRKTGRLRRRLELKEKSRR